MNVTIESWDTVSDDIRETRNFDNRMAEQDEYDAYLALPPDERDRLDAEAEALIPDDVTYMVAASAPPGFFPGRDVADWELFWMGLLSRYETAANAMGRLMDEALAGYDADADLHASWEIAR